MGASTYISSRYAGFGPAIPVDRVNKFSVHYSLNTTALLLNVCAKNSEPTANTHTAVPAAPVHWLRLSAQ
jgi:hypothetical protein